MFKDKFINNYINRNENVSSEYLYEWFVSTKKK
jgi:hypothetical protein